METKSYSTIFRTTTDPLIFFKNYLCWETAVNVSIAILSLAAMIWNSFDGHYLVWLVVFGPFVLPLIFIFPNLPILVYSTEKLRESWLSYVKKAVKFTTNFRFIFWAYQVVVFVLYTIFFPIGSFVISSFVFMSDDSSFHPEKAKATYNKMKKELLINGSIIWIFMAIYIICCFYMHVLNKRMLMAAVELNKKQEAENGMM